MSRELMRRMRQIGSFAGTCFDRYRPDGQTEPGLRRALISNQPHRMQTNSALAVPPRKNYVTIGGSSNQKLSRFKAWATRRAEA